MKTVLVTGANGGLGFSLTKALLEQGYFVVAHYHIHKDLLESLQEKYSSCLYFLQGDVSLESDVLQMKAECEAAGIKVDALVNNAAIDSLSELEEKNKESFLRVFEVNTVGPFLMMKAFGSEINERCGSIINISSDNTIDYYDMVSLEYDVSKAGLNLMTKTFANYFKQAHVNAILFDWLDTPMNDFTEDEKKYISFVPMKVAVSKIQKLIETKESGRLELVKK